MKRNFNQIRLRNLELLIAEAGSATKLARVAGTSSSYVSQVRNQLPTRKGTPRRIGDALAAKLETSMNKPPGWMDDQHEGDLDSTPESPAHLQPVQYQLHPVIGWDEIGKQGGVSEDLVCRYETASLACPVECSSGSFVLRVRGASMEPRFQEGELIFVDPGAVAAHGKYVVVRFEGSNEVTFRQLIVEEGKQYLRALNPDWPHRIIEVDKGAIICGVVVFKGEVV